ncbi:hypothetical protein ACLM5H_25370 [Fredinandcohnia humi]
MKNIESKTLSFEDFKNGSSDFKVIEVTITDSTDQLYAVVTPVKMQ